MQDDVTIVQSSELKQVIEAFTKFANKKSPQRSELLRLSQNGVYKPEHVVSGANTPLLSALSMELTPNSPDADDPEVRIPGLATCSNHVRNLCGRVFCTSYSDFISVSVFHLSAC
jgi:hypothetical protein